MDSAKQQLVEKLKAANNVLVAVSRDPSVDQLAALLGLSLLLNKQGKHCAAVFSGKIPSTLEFLKPEDTIEKNTDSLRDFIIALDKSKADKLRYKVEDNIVRIFITPYKTSISQADLEFSQGDFNVDLVVALGVKDQADLDEAITAHGRILHDAVLASINVTGGSDLGSINWLDQGASSLSELVTDLAQSLGDNLLDEQVATALLTGIVSETNRFSNDKTSSQTMTNSAILMAAGANQQLVATKLEEPVPVDEPHDDSSDQQNDGGNGDDQPPSGNQPEETSPANNDGTLEIDHNSDEQPTKTSSGEVDASNTPEPPTPEFELPEPVDPVPDQVAADDQPPAGLATTSEIMTEPPTLGGTLTANSQVNELDPVTDPLSLPKTDNPQLLDRAAPDSSIPTVEPPQPAAVPDAVNNATSTDVASLPSVPSVDPPSNPPAPSPWSNITAPPFEPPVTDNQPEPPKPPSQGGNEDDLKQLHIDENGTLTQLEEAVHSSHLNPEQETVNPVDQPLPSTPLSPNADAARAEVDKAISTSPPPVPPPIEALNAQPLGPELHAPGNLGAAPTDPTLGGNNLSPNISNPVQPDLGVPSPPAVPPPVF